MWEITTKLKYDILVLSKSLGRTILGDHLKQDLDQTSSLNSFDLKQVPEKTTTYSFLNNQLLTWIASTSCISSLRVLKCVLLILITREERQILYGEGLKTSGLIKRGSYNPLYCPTRSQWADLHFVDEISKESDERDYDERPPKGWGRIQHPVLPQNKTEKSTKICQNLHYSVLL